MLCLPARRGWGAGVNFSPQAGNGQKTGPVASYTHFPWNLAENGPP